MNKPTTQQRHGKVIGITSPGDMGHAIGRELRRHHFDVVACICGRTDRTQELCRQAGIREVESLPQLAVEADVILSVLVPANAESAATGFAQAIRDSETTVHYVDCNAVSPKTSKRIGESIRAAGAVYSDASIVGLPPGTASIPRLYVSGPDADEIQVLDGKGLDVKLIGDEVGQASGIKMCYAAMTKGTIALQYALAIVAERLNLSDQLFAEFEFSQPEANRRMHQLLPGIPSKAWRWVGEMSEIAATFGEAGVTPGFHEAAANIFELMSRTSLGAETPETIDPGRTLEATIKTIVREFERD